METPTPHGRAFDALGDATRRVIFEKLRSGALSVAHIAEGLTVSRPAVSQHIGVLKKANLVRVRREGTKSICSIHEEGVVAMRDYLDQFWGSSLASFKELAEAVKRREQENKGDGLWY